MGSVGDPIIPQIPAVGTAGTAYATNIDLFLTEVKTRLEAKLPLTSLAAGNFDLANNPISNAQYVLLYPQTTLVSEPHQSIFNFGGDLYWVGPSGTVKITNGSALNISGVLGITGDYGGANPAQFRFVDVDQEYYAYDDFGGGGWARLWAHNVDIAAGYTSAVRVRLDSTGVGSSYTLNFPTALPATTSSVYISSTGQLSTKPTLTKQIGAAATGSTANMTAGPAGGKLTTTGGGVAQATLALNMRAGEIITGYTLWIKKTTTGATTLTSQLGEYNATADAFTANLTPGTGTETTSANNPGFTTLSKTGLNYTVTGAAGKSWIIEFYNGGAAAGDIVFMAEVTYQPV